MKNKRTFIEILFEFLTLSNENKLSVNKKSISRTIASLNTSSQIMKELGNQCLKHGLITKVTTDEYCYFIITNKGIDYLKFIKPAIEIINKAEEIKQ